MNGYDFAERVLGQTNYDLLPLIDFAGGGETEWLEFKAATRPKDGVYAVHGKKQDNKWDHYWDISKALVGLSNHIGGVLLLGVNEVKHGDKAAVEVVSLETSGFTGDRDQFMRNIVRACLISPVDGWKTATTGTWLCETLHTVVTPRWGHLFGQPILVLLVHPRQTRDRWLRATQRNGPTEKTLTPCRARGDFGRTDTYTEEQIEDWWNSRDSYTTDLELGYQSFLDQWTGSTKKPNAQTDSIIKKTLSLLLEESNDSEGVFSTDRIGSDFQGNHFLAEADKFEDTPTEGSHPKSPPQMVHSVLNDLPRTVLLGEPGAGKSTCLRIAAIKLAKAWVPGKSWGLIVNLNEYSDSGLRSTILRKLDTLHWIDIEGRLASGELIVFLDALNECPVGRYVECCQDIAALLKLYPRARIHITSRITHNPSQFNLPAYHIRPMSRTQRVEFLGIYLGNSARAEEVLFQLDQQPGAEHFSRSPILLHIVAGIAQEPGASLPSGMANLYRLFLKKWFQRELEKNATNGTPALWSFNGFIDSLALLAFRMQREGRVSCAIEFARESVVPIIGVDHLSKFLDQMAQGLLLKKNRQDDFLQFSHQTIQEYFAAEYLASHPDVLSEMLDHAGTTEPTSGWFLTLVLAFELVDHPSRDFLDAAWAVDPLLVAVALRSDEQLSRLPIHRHSDLWLRGILRAMRAEDTTAEVRELSFISRLPPKYPLPPILTNSLRSGTFWYAGESHPDGRLRLERLRKFLLERTSLWIETMPYLVGVDSNLSQRMSPAQRIIADTQPDSRLLGALNLRETTVIELCTLLRYKKISHSQFAAHWRDALEKSNGVHLETDLLAVIRTAKEFKSGTVRINLRDLDRQHWEILSQIGKHWKLSLRLLNLLVREGFVNVQSIRSDPGRIENIVERISPMNMYRFLKARIIDRKDIPIPQLRMLTSELKPGLVQELIHGRLLLTGDTVGGRLSASDLEHADQRKQIEIELVTKDWEVTVSKVLSPDSIGFVSHPRLSDGAIVFFDRISNPNGRTIRVGDKLRVRLNVQHDRKKNRWGFAVKHGNIITGEHQR